MTKGRSLRLFLVDGTPGGLITAEIMNWTGRVLFGPRSRLDDMVRREEAQRTGVYLLTGDDPEGGYKPLAYVGETDNVGKRLIQHNRDDKMDFWDRACIVTSKDQNLTKAHAKFVESRLIAIIQQASRAQLRNTLAPDYALLPEADTADMDFFVEQIRIVLPVLGLDFLRDRPVSSSRERPSESVAGGPPEAPTFELRSKKHELKAEAREIDGDFVVFEGSQAQAVWSGADWNSYRKQHQQLMEAGVLAPEEEGASIAVFTQDHAFKSPSAASAVIFGRPDNGRLSWRVKGTNQTYADWLEAKIQASAPESDDSDLKVALEDIEGWTGRLIPSSEDFSGEGVAFEAGDVLFGKLRPYLAKVWVASNPGAAVGDFHVLATNRMHPRFVGYLMRSAEFIGLANGSTYGAKMPRVGWDFLASVPIPVPTGAEQEAIASFLDRETAKIDALVAEQERLIALLKEKRQAVISQAVTKGLDPSAAMKDSGVEWLGDVPAHWDISTIGYSCPFISYGRRHRADRRSRIGGGRRMSLHKEVELEDDICADLAAQGWLYAEDDAANYDRVRALFPEDVAAWVKESQPEAWEALEKRHGAGAAEAVLERVRKQMDEHGTLHVLRHGVEMLGLRKPLALAQFKPALGMNPALQARYAANRLRVVRQVRYSLHNENALDLALFLNGLPVATVELKSDFTQSVEDAVDQYRFDRPPRPKGQPAAEPLLEFPRGALVHFAVSNSRVRMTTKLEGAATRFLPFDRGDGGAAGNPPNPDGHRTAYLWEEVWERSSWLELLGRYIVAKKDKKKKLTEWIFPRYHQLDATRKLVGAVLEEKPGGKYLIQHSAGSGKTNSIAWTAHFLADLHDAEEQKLFDSVLVVSDRTVLDSQLQEAIYDFERVTGVVATITGDGKAKSAQLADALSGGKKIVVCTIQTFPFALQEVQRLAATQGKTFAVIADEAHSSQAGTAAAKLKQVLSAAEVAEIEDGGEVATEDLLAAQMQARADADKGVTYVAFTATPKAKTLELFGRRPDPRRPAADDNLPAPFHVYSMRQAIEEGFILDVLQNYISYRLAFKLAHDGKELDEVEVERSAAVKGIMRWVRLHPYNISQKVEIVVEHFRENVEGRLDGKAKAMVVVGSRLEAVRWQLAIDKYIKSRGYKIGTLVAFSGEVVDPESGPDPFSENSAALNPTLKGRDIREAFKSDLYQILLVANKFQTGFDQPLLCGMYVDKRLAGVQAVQTLSRLNRAYPDKTTYILDFVNEPMDVLAAFKPFYETAELAGITDPEQVFNLKAKLDATGYYDEQEVERVVKIELDPKASQAQLEAAIVPVADRLLKQYKAAKAAKQAAEEKKDWEAAQDAKGQLDVLIQFKGDIGAYIRLYTFLSQMFDYGMTSVEKRAIFFRRLLPLLEFGREREGVDLSKVKLTHHRLKNQGKTSLPLGEGDPEKLKPMSDAGGGQLHDRHKALLSQIIEKVNDLFEGDLSDGDKLVYVNNVIIGKLLESETLKTQAANNTKEQFASSPDLETELLNAIIDASDAHSSMSRQALGSEKIRKGLMELLLGPGELYERLKQAQDALARRSGEGGSDEPPSPDGA
eukprot:g235.t1